LGVLLGLAAALCWGTADFLARIAARRIGAYRTLFYMEAIGLVGVSLYVAEEGKLQAILSHALVDGWPLALLLGALSGLSMAAFYRALETGTLSVVAPISSSYPALTVLLAYGSGERLSMPRLLGAALALAGVILTSISPDGATDGAADSPREAKSPPPLPGSRMLGPGVLFAMAASAGFGIIYWLLGFRIIPLWGGITTVWAQRFSTVLFMAALAAPLGRSLSPPRGNTWAVVACVGALDVLGFIASNAGFEREQVGVVTVLGSLFSAVTLLLAGVLLRERLAPRHWLGVALIFAGILLINSHTL
jgi:drug/metabolite transporter (DMT)-like permease